MLSVEGERGRVLGSNVDLACQPRNSLGARECLESGRGDEWETEGLAFLAPAPFLDHHPALPVHLGRVEELAIGPVPENLDPTLVWRYSCRMGVCGSCKVKLLSGSVTMETEDGLEDGEAVILRLYEPHGARGPARRLP